MSQRVQTTDETAEEKTHASDGGSVAAAPYAPVAAAQSSWALWARQVLAVMRLEVEKNFLGRRAFLIYLLAATPIFLMAMVAVFTPDGREWRQFDQLKLIYAAFYNAFVLRTIIFFGCAWIFMNLFRGEVVDRSLHYYFLSPIRREVLVVGKYLSGLVAAIVLFTITTISTFLLLYLPRGYEQSMQYIFDGAGLGQLAAYVGVTILACVGYGAFFLLVGLLFRNPVIPALVMYGWEWLNFLLPPLLKKISVIHYLHSLVPVMMSEGPFAILADPTPAWLSVPGLIIFTLIVLLLASLQIRRMEISYGTE